MGNYALLHCIGVWRKSPIEALSFLFTSLPLSTLIPSKSLHHFLLYPAIPLELSPFASHLSLPHFTIFFPVSPAIVLFALSWFSEAIGESRDRKQLGSQTMEHIKIKKQHQPHQLLTQTRSHTQTQQDKQDIPAAGCTGFLALPNLKRRVRRGVERSGTGRPGENRERGRATKMESEKAK